jgi:hypothetical protein
LVYCENCGNQRSELATACPKCGHPRGGSVTTRRMEGTAVAALVLGIFGIISCPVVLSIPAIIVGNQARARIREDPSLDGEGLARSGVILGWVGIGLALAGVAVALLALAFGVFSSEYNV